MHAELRRTLVADLLQPDHPQIRHDVEILSGGVVAQFQFLEIEKFEIAPLQREKDVFVEGGDGGGDFLLSQHEIAHSRHPYRERAVAEEFSGGCR